MVMIGHWKLKPTSVTFDIAVKALMQIDDTEGVQRVEELRREHLEGWRSFGYL